MNFGINTTTTHYTAVKTHIPEPSPTTSQTQKATEGHVQNDTIYTRFKTCKITQYAVWGYIWIWQSYKQMIKIQGRGTSRKASSGAYKLSMGKDKVILLLFSLSSI